MSSTSYPWRIVAAAVVSIVGYFYLAYLTLFGLSPGGMDVEDKSGHAVVSYLENDGPAARAALVVGDRILTVDGQPIGNVVDWLAHRMNFVADRPIPIGVERDRRRLDLTMLLHGSVWKDYSPRLRASQIIFLASKLITLLIGLFVVFSRPRDFVSRLGGWVLVTMATVFEAFQWGMASAIRSLPFLFQWPVMLIYVSAAFRTPLLFAFFCLFPKKLFRRRWIWIVLLAGPAIATLYALYLLARTVYDPAHLASLAPPWVLIAFGLQSLAYLLAGLLVLPIGYWRLETPTDRRRFRVLFFGVLIGLLFYLPRVFSTALVDFNPSIADFMSSPTLNLVFSAGFLIFPFSFAYAILRHRLFDVRVVIRRGLQYALARGVGFTGASPPSQVSLTFSAALGFLRSIAASSATNTMPRGCSARSWKKFAALSASSKLLLTLFLALRMLFTLSFARCCCVSPAKISTALSPPRRPALSPPTCLLPTN